MTRSKNNSRKQTGDDRPGQGRHPEDRRDALPRFESLEQRLLLSALPVTAGTASFDMADTFLLHSNPTADKVIYLDFDGHTTDDVNYNSGVPFTTPAYSFEGDSSFSNAEKTRIQAIWERVAEDYIPFNVDVTTEEPPADWLIKDPGDPGDVNWGLRVVIGGSAMQWYGSQVWGTAWWTGFSDPTDKPCFAFSESIGEGEKNVAEVITHESGHMFALAHDGQWDPQTQELTDYYYGHGSGDTGWAPIMGAGFNKNLSQWSLGEYPIANNTQDDVAIIAGDYGDFGFRTDDHGDIMGTASALNLNGGNEAFDWGIIEQRTDVDFFSFTTSYAGTVTLDIDPFYRGANLDILATLYDSAGTPLGTSNPVDYLDANFNMQLAAGTYYLSVDGTGKGTSYSDYGSLGQYTITGYLAAPGIDVDAADAFAFEGGPAGTYDVALESIPTGAVEITATADAQGEVSLDGTNYGPSVVFTRSNLTAQTVYVRAIDDAANEGDHTSTITHAITTTGDTANYPTSMTIADAVFSLIDNDDGPVDVILDNGDDIGLHTYTDSGQWNTGGQGYGDDSRNERQEDGNGFATWTFRLTPGTYDVAVTWKENPSNRADNAPFRVLDGTTEVDSFRVDQQVAPLADSVFGGKNFQVLFSQVTITTGTLVVELSNDANGYVIADAVRITTAGPDVIAPTADLASPLNGGPMAPAVLNAQGYIEVTFDDLGGLDDTTITGDEVTISGTGVGTAVLNSGAPTLVSGTTYRYAFTGSFVDGAVDVNFVAGSFADLAGNTNVAETESFTVAVPPFVAIIDDGDAGFSIDSGTWGDGSGVGYQGDVRHNNTGNNSDVASWTFTGLAAGDYQVAISWRESSNRATNSPFRVLDLATEVATQAVDQEAAAVGDYVIEGANFEIIFATVTINSGTMVVELSNNGANEYVVADGVRIQQLSSAPDTTAPTADLANPLDGATIAPATLNAQGYIDVTFADSGDGVGPVSITGDELTISGTGVGTAVLSGSAVLVSGTTYRYAFTGSFVDGDVDVNFVAGSFADLASNANVAETESFTVFLVVDTNAPTADLANPLDSATIEPATLNSQGYIDVTFADVGDGLDTATITGDELAISGAGVGTAVLAGTATLVSPATYRYAFTGSFVDGAVDVDFVAGTFADLAANSNAAETESFTVATATFVQIIDDGGAGYAWTGTWGSGSSGGYQDDVHHNNTGTNSDTATWTFTGLSAGTYEVAITWKNSSNRATNSPFRVLDDTTQVGPTAYVDQEVLPVADHTEGGRPFEIIFASVTINSGTMVVELSNNGANEFVLADAVRIEQLTTGADTVAPTVDLASPVDSGSMEAATLNAQGYIEVTFADVGDGLDSSTITGDELAISGTGVGTAVLSGTAVVVSGTTFRYAFTGSFVDGDVDVDFVAGTFADLASNTNAAETESFTVGTVPFLQIIDDGDAGFAWTGSWGNGSSGGYQDDVRHNNTGNDSDTATWTFTGLPTGTYEVAVTWKNSSNRATNSPFRVLDNTTEVDTTTVDQEVAPVADYTLGGRPFEILFASVTINSGTMVVELSNIGANEFVLADAVRIERVTAAPDTDAPTADLVSPADSDTIDPDTLNTQGYIEVTFADVGGGLDAATITGDELAISGAGVGTAVLSGVPTLVSGTTYRYSFTGSFVDGAVNVDFVAGSFADQAANTNVLETEAFTVLTVADTFAPTADLDNPSNGLFIDPTVLNGQGYIDVTFSDIGDGIDGATITGDELTISGAGVGTAVLDGTALQVVGRTYRYNFTGSFVEGAVAVDFVAGSFADLAGNTNAAESEAFTVQILPYIEIVDNGDLAFSYVGTWSDDTGGYEGDFRTINTGSGSDAASWTFTGLEPGTYEVAISWVEAPDRATDSPWFVLDDGVGAGSTTVNQQNAPQADYVIGGRNFEIIFATVTITDTRLDVVLTANANGYVVADAVRIKELFPPEMAAPEADLATGGSSDGDTSQPLALPDQAVGLATSPAILGLTPAQQGTAGRSDVVLPAAAQPGPRANAGGAGSVTLAAPTSDDTDVFASSGGGALSRFAGGVAPDFQADGLDVDLLADVAIEPLMQL